MSSWRWLVVLLLYLLPIVVFTICGAWALWSAGWLGWLWWIFPVCWGLAYLLMRPARQPPGEPSQWPAHWTPRDEAALRIIEAQQEAALGVPPERLTEARFYFDTAQDLALKMARHYHPGADDPLASLTVPEILTAAQLALEDCDQWIRDHVPGSHLLTVAQWRSLAKAPGWLRTARDVAWLVSVLVQPALLMRFAASRFTSNAAAGRLQSNLLMAFCASFLRHTGFYLIELNSGRLRGGAARYRALQADLATGRQRPTEAAASVIDAAAAGLPATVTIGLIGQAKSGKSSLANALLGEQKARTDVLPATDHVQRYRLEWDHAPDRLILLDTPGYAADGATDRQRQETSLAIESCDLVLLVIDVTQPGRQADLAVLEKLLTDYRQTEHRHKPPPILAVLTHIDQLTPVLEWNPPYDWTKPVRPKEHAIHDAVAYNASQLHPFVAGAVPVCTDMDHQRVYGVEDWLVPAMLSLLESARGRSLLRALHEEWDATRVTQVFRQCLNLGRSLLRGAGF